MPSDRADAYRAGYEDGLADRLGNTDPGEQPLGARFWAVALVLVVLELLAVYGGLRWWF